MINTDFATVTDGIATNQIRTPRMSSGSARVKVNSERAFLFRILTHAFLWDFYGTENEEKFHGNVKI